MKNKTKNSPSTLKPSHPTAFKSSFFIEDKDWDAVVKVDYDSKVNPISTTRIAKFIKRIVYDNENVYSIIGCIYKVFKTAKGHHLRIWFHRENCKKIITATSILRFQRDLNDDPMRQRFNSARVRRGEPYWNVLWNLKMRNGKIISQEIEDYELSREIEDKIRLLKKY